MSVLFVVTSQTEAVTLTLPAKGKKLHTEATQASIV